MNPNANEDLEVRKEDEAAWDQAYEALVLNFFDADKAVLLLKLLEKPDLLREALEYFVSCGQEDQQ